MDEPLDVSKTGIFYSPPKTKIVPTEGRGRANTSGSDSSMSELIIPEENSNVRIVEEPEGKYSNRDARHSARHKHRRHERHFKGGEILDRICESCATNSLSSVSCLLISGSQIFCDLNS